MYNVQKQNTSRLIRVIFHPWYTKGLFLGNEGIRDLFIEGAARGEQITYLQGA